MMKTTLAAALLALAPTFALAEGCQWGHSETTAMSCAEGTQLDSTTGTCVPVASS